MWLTEQLPVGGASSYGEVEVSLSCTMYGILEYARSGHFRSQATQEVTRHERRESEQPLSEPDQGD